MMSLPNMVKKKRLSLFKDSRLHIEKLLLFCKAENLQSRALSIY